MKTAFPIATLACFLLNPVASGDMTRIQFNNPGLIVDLGVGLWAWPMPMDWDRDGDLDLVVSCPDVPYNGTWFFENPDPESTMPVFKAPVRIGDSLKNARLSYVDGDPRVLTPMTEWIDFLGRTFESKKTIYPAEVHDGFERVRADQWHFADYDGDGSLDLIVGIGVWDDYGWDDAHNTEGDWVNGPLHGFVYLLRNEGSTGMPAYADPVRIEAAGKPVDVYGMPSPSLADFDHDGDLDLLCGEFMDGFTYFQNTGSRSHPVYAGGRRLAHEGRALAMHVQMITPVAVDWDRDGDVDIVVGDEDGRVALIEHTGKTDADGVPLFLPPEYFQQEAGDLKFGALVTPVSVDWDGDGDEDLVCGNTSGNIAWIENLDGGNPPKWAPPELLEAGGVTIHFQAGPKGSIQGPCEAKWGYTTFSVADWNHDGLLDLIANSIWGKVVWFENTGTKTQPLLAAARPITVEWEGTPPKPAWNWWDPESNELTTQWRTTPVAVDWNENGLTDLVMLDHEGYLAFFQRERRDGGRLVLLPGRRVFSGGVYDRDGKQFDSSTDPLRLNNGHAGKSGRRKLCIVDWDGDGRRDLLLNSRNTVLHRNVGESGGVIAFEEARPLAEQRLAGHTTSPTTVDWDRDGVRDLLVGAEDGRFYFKKNDLPVRPR